MKKILLIGFLILWGWGICYSETPQEILNSIEYNKEFYTQRSFRVILNHLQIFTSSEESIINGKVNLKFIIIHKPGLLQVKEFEISEEKESITRIKLYHIKGLIDYHCKKRVIRIYPPSRSKDKYPNFSDSPWGISSLDAIYFNKRLKNSDTVMEINREGRPCYLLETTNSEQIINKEMEMIKGYPFSDAEFEKYFEIISNPKNKISRIWLDKGFGNLPVYAEIFNLKDYYFIGENTPCYIKYEFGDFTQVPNSLAWYCGKAQSIKFFRDQKGLLKSTEQHKVTSILESEVDLKNEDFLLLFKQGDLVADYINDKTYAVGEDGKLDPPLETILEF